MKRVFSLVVLAVLLLTPRLAAAGDAKAQPAAQWSAKMQSLYKTLSELLTDVTSDWRFHDPANTHRIDAEASRLATLVHDLGQKVKSPDADPTVPILAKILGQETKRAVALLKSGDRDYARSLLRSIPSTCMACHTRNATGPQFSSLELEPSTKSLSHLEKGEFYAATRQFDRAQKEFIDMIEDPHAAETNIFNWERAVQQGLAIAVRVKQDPEQTLRIVHLVLSTPTAPLSIKKDASTWLASAEAWQQEPKRQAASEEGYRAEALRLLVEAHETQKYPMDRSADVIYLRASAATHDLLQSAPQGERAAEALYLAGLSYEVLGPLRLEDLHDLYYEACIRQSPHTATADACYQRYEQSIFFGYSGSIGTDIPADVRGKLDELRKLSQPMIEMKPKG